VETKQINQLMLAMGRTGIKKLVLKKDGVELQLEREERAPCRTFDVDLQALEENPMRGEIERHRTSPAVAVPESEKTFAGKTAVVDENALFVTSPMVGTFYRSPSPNDPSFVQVGDKVEKNTVVCIIEAMKVMNEVKADVSGTVAECLIEDRHPVEFGTKLFRIIQNT
jgi:acetyl-CoA carboxylase biotin carboxyl carrier protein